MGSLAATGSGQRHRRLGSLRAQAKSLSARDSVSLSPPAQHQHRRGHQQHHQSHQAPRLRLPRSGVLLPQDPVCIPRYSSMNLIFPLVGLSLILMWLADRLMLRLSARSG
ncbi:hypothetical protein L501_2103 [Bordetella holmesii CDC-H719-BH]|nr:hypothetical protein L501_2103 [Bordetella holmesii CDC-H719-BH]